MLSERIQGLGWAKRKSRECQIAGAAIENERNQKKKILETTDNGKVILMQHLFKNICRMGST